MVENMLNFISRCLSLLVALSLAFAAFAQDTSPEGTPESTCTLAEQIMSSNTDTKVGVCPILEGMEAFQLREDIVLTERLPAITSYFIIDGNGHTISGDRRFRIFEVQGGRLTVSNLNMIDGKAGLGSAIFADKGATVYIESSSIKRSAATYSGAIFARFSQLYVNNSEISWNIADTGAAIYSPSSNIHVTLSRFERNGSREGGAIYHYAGRGTIKNSEFHNNSASEDGGAIVNGHGVLQVRDSVFSQNSGSAGGAIYSLGYDSLLSVVNSRFEYNDSRGEGGAIYANSDDVFISDSTFENNSAGTMGGGIYTERGALFLAYSNVQSGFAAQGAGLYTDGGSVTIIDTTIADNISSESGEQLEFEESDVRFLDIRDV